MNALNVDEGRASKPVSALAHAREALPALCAALGLAARAEEATGLFEVLTEPWGSGPIDGQSHYEFSFAIGAREPEVRFLVGSRGAGRPLTGRLADAHGIVAAPLARVEDLFEGSTVRHVAVLRGSAPPSFEVVFDAQARGRWKAAAVVEEALVRLGFGRAWPSIADRVLRRGPYLDELKYFAVSLGRDGRTAVKLYVQHHDATMKDVRAVLEGAPVAERAEAFCLAVTGSTGPYRAQPLVSMHTFEDAGDREPTTRALYVPAAGYGPNDAVTRGRTSGYLALLGLSSDAYEQALAVYARRPLAARAGLHTYVGLRDDRDGPSVVVDLSPDLEAPARHDGASSAALPPPEEICRRFENDIVLADHPFMRRLAREPVQIGHLWLVLANFWHGIVHDFPRRVSHVLANIDDDRIRCVLTKQLNDELGEGNFDRAHKAMFQTLIKAVEPHRLEGSDDVLFAPGKAFGHELGDKLMTDDPFVAVGKIMMIEIYGKQTDLFMGSQFRRQDRIDAKALHWLHLHEDLEVDHADDSLTLARCVPQDPAAIAKVWEGAEAVVTASRLYFDALYRICFG